MISPFVTGKELDARFAAGDTQGALDLTHLLWDQMTDENGPYYTGAMWEKLNRDGTDVDANASLSHGWATAPTPALSHYVLGVQPVTAGYKTWLVAPQTGDLEWAQGTRPDAAGRARLALGRAGRRPLVHADGVRSGGHVRHGARAAVRPLADDRDGRHRRLAGRRAAGPRPRPCSATGRWSSPASPGRTRSPSARSRPTRRGTVGGTVPATLSLTLGTPAPFGAFIPGVATDLRRRAPRRT